MNVSSSKKLVKQLGYLVVDPFGIRSSSLHSAHAGRAMYAGAVRRTVDCKLELL